MFKKLILAKAKENRGFTLIELIVVIAILGILAAILVPSMTNFIQTAKEQTANANARTAYVAAQTYLAQQRAKGEEVTSITEDDLKDLLGGSFEGEIEVKVTDGEIEFVTWKENSSSTIVGTYPPK